MYVLLAWMKSICLFAVSTPYCMRLATCAVRVVDSLGRFHHWMVRLSTHYGNNVNKCGHTNRCRIFLDIWWCSVLLHVVLDSGMDWQWYVWLFVDTAKKEDSVQLQIIWTRWGRVCPVLVVKAKQGRFCTVSCSLHSKAQRGQISPNWTDHLKLWDSFNDTENLAPKAICIEGALTRSFGGPSVQLL